MHRIPLELRSYAYVGESSTRMGDHLGSPCVAPLFLGLFGSYGVPFRPPTCHPNEFDPPHRHRSRTIVDPATRSQDTGFQNRASGNFPRFLPRGGSHRLRTIGGNGRLFRRSRQKLWVETVGGGVPFRSATCRPNKFGTGRSSIRSPDRKIRAVEIARLVFFPVFFHVEDPIV